MFIADHAIIMAAGMGIRMRPLTEKIPKPLVKVNGTAMIETIIQGLHSQHIEEIYIVVGYQKEKFQFLTEKYPHITLVENPYYQTRNNISSMYAVREHIPNAMMVDGDQVIYNREILDPTFERSGYSAAFRKEGVSEWMAVLDEEGIIKDCIVETKSAGWQLLGVSRWNLEDGTRLKEQLEYEYEVKKNYGSYWDNLPLLYYRDTYRLGVKEAQYTDILEIDSFEDLCNVDPSYKTYRQGI